MDNPSSNVEPGGIEYQLSGRKWNNAKTSPKEFILAGDKKMFIGEYRHTVDEKKRISLPAKFRKELGSKVVVTRGLDNCLVLYPHKVWEAQAKEAASLGMMQHDRRGYSRFLFSGASEIEVDSMGRILIPDFLKEFAKLKSPVIFTGLYDRIEIWNEKLWAAYMKKNEAEAEKMAENLGSAGK